MSKNSRPVDYVLFDRPEILRFLFYPRADWSRPVLNRQVVALEIPVDSDHVIGGFFHASSQDVRTILMFHGNGEIASDYHELAPFFTDRGMNLLVVDYRGYGRSSGNPSVEAMMKDCHTIFSYVQKWLKRNEYKTPLILMGRSLGSASALEVAYRCQDQVGGLIIESGFAYIGPLLALMGISMTALDLTEDQGFRNLEKMLSIKIPTLVIHGQYDQIISHGEGKALFEACAAKEKKFLTIMGANHNNLFLVGMNEYMQAIAWLDSRVGNGDE